MDNSIEEEYMIEAIGAAALSVAKKKAISTVLNPLNEMVDEQLTDISTTIGSFIIRSVRGKFQRSISFTIGVNYSDAWMEEALYGILYKYNNIKKGSKLELMNKKGFNDGSCMYYVLDDGTHNLKYRDYNILLHIQTKQPTAASGRITNVRTYTIITYNLDPKFVQLFEKDMLHNRNCIFRIKSDSPTFEVWQDGHEHDGYTYWSKVAVLPKRKLNTVYLPKKDKELLVSTINRFFASKKYYEDHGIPWTLKILLYGEPGTGKGTITKMIVSEWNRCLYECKGGKNGRFIPDAISDNNKELVSPVFSISDIDKYPALINEQKVDMNKDGAKEEELYNKQIFNNMINALDGITTEGGRIIIMTTNHKELFSDTFLRPGRIDLQLYVTYLVPETFRQYVFNEYGIVLPKNIELTDDKLTISKLQFDVIFRRMPSDEFLRKYVKDFDKLSI